MSAAIQMSKSRVLIQDKNANIERKKNIAANKKPTDCNKKQKRLSYILEYLQ